jgi:hypothetical protein
MFNFRDVAEVAVYCAATVVIGTGSLALSGAFDHSVTGTAVSGPYFDQAANFRDSAVSEPGRVTDLRDCDIDPETGVFYEVGACSDHEIHVAQTYGTR